MLLYPDFGASSLDVSNGKLSRLLELLRRYEQQPDPSKYFMDWVRRIFRSSSADIELIGNALALANEAHKDQKRLTHESYIIHPISSAAIIGEYLGLLDPMLLAGTLLHDAKEDNEAIWTKRKDYWRIDPLVAAIVEACNRNRYAEIKNKEAQDAAFLGDILYAKSFEVKMVKTSEKLQNNVTAAPWKLLDADWRTRKAMAIHMWYEPMTRDTGHLIHEMVASRIAIKNGIRLIALP